MNQGARARTRKNRRPLSNLIDYSSLTSSFDIKDTHAYLSTFLHTVCANADTCLGFGQYSELMNRMFRGFTSMRHLQSPIKRIGAPSSNGIVHEFTYSVGDYIAHAVLKSIGNVTYKNDIRQPVDSLMYEYLVGKRFINHYSRIFPCFLETYGVLCYKDYNSRSKLLREQTLPSKFFKEELIPIDDSGCKNINDYGTIIEDSCVYPDTVSILIQFVPMAKSLKAFYTEIDDTFNAEYQLLQLLFQVYLPLSTMSDIFTHYDLHTDNVMLYDLGSSKCIQLKYHMNDGSLVSFKTHLLSKIIDYGRCFYYMNANDNSKIIYKKACEKCAENCGYNQGYSWLASKEHKANIAFIASRIPNQTHDLRVISELKLQEKDSSVDNKKPFMSRKSYIKDLFKKLKYNNSSRRNIKQYGAPPANSSNDGMIRNVIDAARFLGLALHTIEFVKANHDFYETRECVGILDIYESGKEKMKFSYTIQAVPI